LVLLFVVMLAGRVAAADPAAADRAAAQADALARDGKFGEAAAKFREAWQADPLRPELFCNIGISYYKAKDLPRAHLLLGQCLEQAALAAKQAAAVRDVVGVIEGVLRSAGDTPVRVVVEPLATAITLVELFPDPAFVGSRVVWLPAGSYHLRGHAEGYADATAEVQAASPEPQTVTITLRRPVQADGVATPTRETTTAARSRAPAYVATGAAVIAAGVAGYAYVAGHARAELAGSALDRPTLDADRQAVTRWKTTVAVAAGAAAACAAVSGYLWYRALHRDPRIEVHAGQGRIGATFTARF
jgi:tetratricopeptide (TPR) repeat protein